MFKNTLATISFFFIVVTTSSAESENNMQKNIFGEPLQECCTNPMTGFFRDGYCRTNAQDLGSHTVCATMTKEFLEFTKSKGNDLSTPRPEFSFPGLKEGDRWCLCALRWKEAYDAGFAPPLHLDSCHEKSLQYIPIEALREYQSQ